MSLSDELVDLAGGWPEVPEARRPKRLPHAGTITGVARLEALRMLGWDPIDVRLIDDPAEALRAHLEGIRLGTIELTKGQERYLELEARVHGLVGPGSKDRTSDDPDTEIAQTLEELFKLRQ